MKKQVTIICAALAALCLLAGCTMGSANSGTSTSGNTSSGDSATSTPTKSEVSSDTSATTDPTEAPVEETKTPEDSSAKEDDKDTVDVTHYTQDVYPEQLAAYTTAVSEEWDIEKLTDNKLCTLVSGSYDTISYAFVDLDKDGTCELIIGANDKDNPVAYEIWTVKDDKPVMLAQSAERDRYFILHNEDDDTYTIASSKSNSAFNSMFATYKLEKGELKALTVALYDSSADEANPWFSATTDDWDTTTATKIDEAAFKDLTAEEGNYYLIETYTAYTDHIAGTDTASETDAAAETATDAAADAEK